MNDITFVRDMLTAFFPDAEFTLDKPLRSDGVWSLDVSYPDYLLVITWSEARGFGLTADNEHGYGEGADEAFATARGAVIRAINLIQFRLETVPPYPVRIRELREKLGVSQTDLANRMGVQQAAVSKMESRDDTLVSSLRNYVKALGLELVVKAVLPGSGEEILIPAGN